MQPRARDSAHGLRTLETLPVRARGAKDRITEWRYGLAALALAIASCGRCGDRPRADTGAARTEDVATRHVPARSAGCDRSPPEAGTGEPHTVSLSVNGVERSYVLSAPEADESEARPLVLAFHGSGADGAKIRAHLDLERHAHGRAAFAYPDGLDPTNPAAWNLTAAGRDVAFALAIVSDVEARRCVDERAIFAVGFSYGGWMVNALACARPGLLRGIASIEGGGPNVPCSGRVAAMIIHGGGDFDEPITSGEATRDYWLAANACGKSARRSAAPECAAFDGCAAGDPVLFCRHDGGHVVPDFAPAAVWAFFESLR